MAGKQDERNDSLPVTAELGDEGGSYGDATMQAETFTGEAGNPRIDPKQMAATGQEAGSMTPERAPSDLRKHADEPEDPSDR
jgi:hypothetical protein